ncbi:hypothetical protein ACFGY2_11450 [Pasteurella multocida]
MFSRHLDEMRAVYQLYKQALKENEKRAFSVYIALLMGGGIYCLMILNYGFSMWFFITFILYEIVVLRISYNVFREIYLDLNSPK